MAIKEQRTLLDFKTVYDEQTVSSDTGIQSLIFDSNRYNSGVTYMFTGSSDIGTVTLSNIFLEESDDDAMAGATTVPDSSLTNEFGAIVLDVGGGDIVSAVGVIGTKRYLRLTFDTTFAGSAAIGAISVILIGGLDIKPELGVNFG